jgi:uncharacterized MAPEG superfamily protein
MTLELRLLLWTLVLGLVQLVAAAVAKRLQEPRGWAAGPRDEDVPRYTGIAARLARAQANLMETLPFFAAAILVCHAVGREGGLSALGAQLYFWGRVVYVPLYALGTPYVRTLVWIAATAGLCLILAACLG